jgi:hypothetical protein
MGEQLELMTMIDEALQRFGARELVSSAEVLDFLLDLRIAAAADPLTELLESEAQPAGT